MDKSDNPEERERYRSLSIAHCDSLVDLGHWTKCDIRLKPMWTQEERIDFMHKVDRDIPRDISYYQMWGSTNPPVTIIKLWCQTDRVDVWKQFLKNQHLLSEKERQPSPADSSTRAERLSEPGEE